MDWTGMSEVWYVFGAHHAEFTVWNALIKASTTKEITDDEGAARFVNEDYCFGIVYARDIDEINEGSRGGLVREKVWSMSTS